MFIQNAVLKSISAEGLTFPLSEGSVVSVGGVTGIVPTTLGVRPATNRIYVAVAGTIDMTSDANKGVTFTDEQIKALGGDFNFVPALESPAEIPAYSSTQNGKFLGVSSGKLTWTKELPSVSGGDNGKVLTVSSGAWSAQTPSGSHDYYYIDLSTDGSVEYESAVTLCVQLENASSIYYEYIDDFKPVIIKFHPGRIDIQGGGYVPDTDITLTGYVVSWSDVNSDGYSVCVMCSSGLGDGTAVAFTVWIFFPGE